MEDNARVEEITKLKGENEALKAENTIIKNMIPGLRAEKAAAEETSTDLLKQFISMKAHYLALDNKCKSVEAALKEKETNVKDLTQKVSELNQKLEASNVKSIEDAKDTKKKTG